jgi:PAS domain S-box-containing protein
MGRMGKSRTVFPGATKRRERISSDSKDALLAALELKQTQSQIEIEHLRRLNADGARANRRIESLFRRSPVGYVTLNELGLIVDWNPAAAGLLNLGKRDLLNAPFAFFAVQEEVEILLRHLRRCKRTEEERVISELHIKKGPKEIPIQLVSVPFFEEGKRFFQTAIIDLTERKKNERALEEAQRFSETIIQTIHEPLLVVDMNLKVLQANEAFARLFGLSPQLIKNKPLESILNLWWRGNALRMRLEDTLLKNIPLNNFECEIHPRNLGRRIFLFNAQKLRGKQDSLPALLIAIEDITARKDAEARLTEAYEQLKSLNGELEKRVEARTRELQASNKQLEGFCYTIAHDLRAPLRAMAGFGAALQDDFAPQLGSQGSSYVQRIITAAEQMDSLIHGLLEFGRFTTLHFERNSVDAEEVLAGVVSRLQPMMEEKRASVRRHAPLPRVSGHKVILETAFSNLLTNALKFVPPHRAPEITIWPEQQEDQIRIWIADNGIGIEKRYQDKIFEVFQRLHSQAEYPGTGVGLAIVQRALQRIGGKVGVESEAGKGSRFWISLPRAS